MQKNLDNIYTSIVSRSLELNIYDNEKKKTAIVVLRKIARSLLLII